MSETSKTRIATVSAPYGREIWLDDVVFASGMSLLRVTIKEGRRFTQLDLDRPAAEAWSQVMTDWSREAEMKSKSG